MSEWNGEQQEWNKTKKQTKTKKRSGVWKEVERVRKKEYNNNKHNIIVNIRYGKVQLN